MIAIDMEMPSSCGFCALLTWIGDGKKWFCPVTGRRFMRAYDQRQDDCPLLGVTKEAEAAICEIKKSEEKLRLTPVGCLYAVLLDYVGPDHLLDIRKIQGRVGEHIVEDFMDAMVKAGYLERKSDEKEEDVLHSDLHEGR